MLTNVQVQPDPTFKPCDIRKIGYPTDPRITRYPTFGSLLDRLRPIKAQYEGGLHYDMLRSVVSALCCGCKLMIGRYRVCEPEIPCGIPLMNKRRKRARDQNLNVSMLYSSMVSAEKPNCAGTSSRLLQSACTFRTRSSKTRDNEHYLPFQPH